MPFIWKQCRNVLLVALSCLPGCAALDSRLVDISYSLRDEPASERVILEYKNTTNRTICLSPEHWPNSAGRIDQPAGAVVLMASEAKYPMEGFNTGYCPQGCAIAVKPGTTIASAIPYKHFNLPRTAFSAPKRLDFHPIGFVCSGK